MPHSRRELETAGPGGPPPASDTERSSDCDTGLSSPLLRDKLMAECGTKAPGVLNGYIDLQFILCSETEDTFEFFR